MGRYSWFAEGKSNSAFRAKVFKYVESGGDTSSLKNGPRRKAGGKPHQADPESKSVQAACETFARVLGAGNPDLPFAILYLLDEDRRFASLIAKTGIDDAFAPEVIQLDHNDPWGIARVIRDGEVILWNPPRF